MRVDDYVWGVIRGSDLAPAARAVLWAIAHHVNRRTGETFVGMGTIADGAGLSLDQTRRHVHQLAAAGVFAVTQRPGRSPLYRFPTHPALSTPLAPMQGDPSRGRESHPLHRTPRPLAPDAVTPRVGASRTAYNRVERATFADKFQAKPRPEIADYDDCAPDQFVIR